jgi:1,2-diacylglycerol 3-alpha-glucosyltransferase
VIWIDWYSYHISRFRALLEHEKLKGQVTGIELVGGCGVHTGMKFRDQDREGLPITSLFPTADWNQAKRTDLARAVWKKLNELRPSAVLVPGLYTLPGFAAALWAKLHGKRSILMSETTYRDYERVWWKELPKRLLMGALFDYGIAGGKPHARYLRKLGFSPERIARFYDVVDNLFFLEAADGARRSPKLREISRLPQAYFLYVGRLSPEKNVDSLVQSFARYHKRGGTWSLVLVGDGPERAHLEQLCDALGIADRVQFAGFKPTRDIIPYYAFAGCFVLPSIREPWGLVVNEAMASGLPVIVSSQCGCAEDLVEPGGNGYLFNAASAEDLTGRLTSMSGLDESTLGAMGQRSLQIIAGYSPQHWAAEVARIVQQPSRHGALFASLTGRRT